MLGHTIRDPSRREARDTKRESLDELGSATVFVCYEAGEADVFGRWGQTEGGISIGICWAGCTREDGYMEEFVQTSAEDVTAVGSNEILDTLVLIGAVNISGGEGHVSEHPIVRVVADGR